MGQVIEDHLWSSGLFIVKTALAWMVFITGQQSLPYFLIFIPEDPVQLNIFKYFPSLACCLSLPSYRIPHLFTSLSAAKFFVMWRV